jgi:hypothetical protein
MDKKIIFSWRESDIAESMLLHVKECRTDQQARKLIDQAYKDGLSIDELYYFYVTMKPAYI